MDDDKTSELLSKLEVITNLLAHLVAQEHETLETKSIVLASAGLKPKEIALVCGTTAGTVSVRLAEAKKKLKKKRK